ncbi:CaiB/BaiF CoA transferase family protein [Sneathiella aquimaris]|uniref:CaiB/BaiF CoA transferase family protein n=1 Tax=Sneathiella aquimaris TaxID=2599305 RepID=UPI00146E6959|nr:CoA transferase [Sneathiella aquimaris]
MNDSKPLSGLKIADFSQGVAGPYSAMMLAQGGADVTKVEPLDGDWARTLGTMIDDHCAHSIVVNLGKKSISLDLKTAEGLKIAKQIAAEADVLIESFRPGVMAKFGLDYASVSATNKNIIYLSVTGYGQEGPYNDRPVTDGAIQAFSGWMTMTKDDKGMPLKTGMVAIDFLTGIFAYQTILKSLIGRGINGKGTYVDASLMQTAAAFQSAKILEHHLEGGKPTVLYVPVGTVETSDGYIGLSVMREKHYASLCEVLGREDLIDHPDYNTRDKRIENEDAIMKIIRAEFLKKNTQEWCRALTEAGVIHSRVNTYDDYLADEQVKAVNSYNWIDHDVVGKIPLPRIPGFAGFENGDELAHSPIVGEHSTEILKGLGIEDEQIKAMIDKGAVLQK